VIAVKAALDFRRLPTGACRMILLIAALERRVQQGGLACSAFTRVFEAPWREPLLPKKLQIAPSAHPPGVELESGSDHGVERKRARAAPHGEPPQRTGMLTAIYGRDSTVMNPMPPFGVASALPACQLTKAAGRRSIAAGCGGRFNFQFQRWQ
jgi:hypothetical protein